MSRNFGVNIPNYDDDDTTVMLSPAVVVIVLLVAVLALVLSPLWLPVLALRWLWRVVSGYVAGVRWARSAQHHISVLFLQHRVRRRSPTPALSNVAPFPGRVPTADDVLSIGVTPRSALGKGFRKD